MPTITVKTLTSTVKTSTPTLKELRKFNDGDCLIYLLPTTPDAATTITTGTQLDCALLCPPGSVLSSEATEANKASKAIDSPPTLEAAAKTPCGHIFHASCLEPWIGKWRNRIPTLVSPDAPTCPYCRSALTTEPKETRLKGYTLDQIFKKILRLGVWNLSADAQGKPYFWFVASVGVDVICKMWFEEVGDLVQDGEGERDAGNDAGNEDAEKEAGNKDEDKDAGDENSEVCRQ
jgi:hypothetical protein